MTAVERQTFWLAPSGRIHKMRTCSGAAPANRMKRVQLTRDEFDATSLATNRCRCARWRRSDQDARR